MGGKEGEVDLINGRTAEDPPPVEPLCRAFGGGFAAVHCSLNYSVFFSDVFLVKTKPSAKTNKIIPTTASIAVKNFVKEVLGE